MSGYIDVTLPIENNCIVYPEDPECRVTQHFSIAGGDEVNLKNLSFGSHTGTHVDAPFHIYKDGRTLQQLEMKHFLGTAKVFDFSCKDTYIDRHDIENLDISRDDIIIFKTKNSALLTQAPFNEDYVYLKKDAAHLLAQKQIATLGFDYMSVDKPGSLEVHKALLGADIIIMEGLNLSQIQQGEYDIVSLPMLIQNGDGAPARVLLKQRRQQCSNKAE